MNYLAKIEQIRKDLTTYGHEYLAKDILELQSSGGTGGEVLLMVCSRLLGIKENDSKAYGIIEEYAESLIIYANSLGLYPKPTYLDSNEN